MYEFENLVWKVKTTNEKHCQISKIAKLLIDNKIIVSVELN